MRQLKLGVVILATLILAACGGGGSDVPAKPKFASQVTFGDSLSDVGSYKAGVVSVLGGGQFTINVASTPTNWTELTATQLGLPAPCAHEVGIDDGGANVVGPTFNTSCYGYAQGGARVTNPVGLGNKNFPGGGLALTVPVVTQIANHLAAHGGSFNGDEIVYVMAGANDVFVQAGAVGGGLPLADAITALQTAAGELATAVNTQILANGAKYVVVVNIPDIGTTPQVTSIADPVARAQSKGLFDALVSAFNTQLATDLPDSANVLNIDAFTASKDEVANPSKYNLTDVATPVCGANALGTTSLACNSTNLIPGVAASDHYLFADNVHPTPYGHALFATYVLQSMVSKGWF